MREETECIHVNNDVTFLFCFNVLIEVTNVTLFLRLLHIHMFSVIILATSAYFKTPESCNYLRSIRVRNLVKSVEDAYVHSNEYL